MVRLIRKESKKLYRKEDNFYSSNLGVDDIEDIIASGLDWTSDEFDGIDDSELMSKKEYDDASKLITIEEAEAIIGKRPDATKPKPPTSAMLETYNYKSIWQNFRPYICTDRYV